MSSGEPLLTNGTVVGVGASPSHSFSKQPQESITLLTGLGVLGDAHCGEKVKHRSRVAKNPDQPNLRQVHLIHEELFQELAEQGFAVEASEIGENVTTRGLDLLKLPRGTRLHLGTSAVVEVAGLRNPCVQLDDFHKGLKEAVLGRAEDGSLIRKTGIMGVVAVGGEVRRGDGITVELPPLPHLRLEPV